MMKCQAAPLPYARPTLCFGMRSALAGVPENHDGKGLSLTRGWIGDEKGKPRYLGVIYKRAARDAGTVLNVCPWCGASVRFDETTSGAGDESVSDGDRN